MINICDKLFDFDKTIFDNYLNNFKQNIDVLNNMIKLISQYDSSVTPVNNDKQCIDRLKDLYDKFIIYFDSKNQQTEEHSLIITEDIKQIYANIMKPLQFELCANLVNICKVPDKIINQSRVIRETSVLSKSLPFDYESSIYIKIDETNMQSIQALIIPSHNTPYSCGCFLFHIYLPDVYPTKPPLVKLITTGNGTVRFNPNLYADGTVCLSLLGTWHGDVSESWNESSSILQVLISIQSLIFIEQPYFNEPGNERNVNSINSKIYNQTVQYNTICWAMIDMLKQPPQHFTEIIRNHFKLKKEHIIAETKKWLDSLTSNNAIKFAQKREELCELLNNL
jgi:baculoviral IAP repeat-containing protein 6